MQLMCIIVTIGTAVQTASVNFGMFLAGRVLAGFAVGYVEPPYFLLLLLFCRSRWEEEDMKIGC